MTDTTTYDSETDPMRVDEPTLREALKADTEIGGGRVVVEQGRYTKGGRGCYASLMVIARDPNAYDPQRPYSTHEAYVPSEADGLRPPGCQSGRYDLTLAEAMADLAAR